MAPLVARGYPRHHRDHLRHPGNRAFCDPRGRCRGRVLHALKGLLHTVSEMLDESVKPTLESVKNAAETVRGTTEFVGKTAVTPIIRTHGAFAGVRKGLGVLTSLSGRKGK